MPRRPVRFPHAYPTPYEVHDRVDGYIPLHTSEVPSREIILVPVNGDLLAAEQTAALLAYWSSQRGARA